METTYTREDNRVEHNCPICNEQFSFNQSRFIEHQKMHQEKVKKAGIPQNVVSQPPMRNYVSAAPPMMYQSRAPAFYPQPQPQMYQTMQPRVQPQMYQNPVQVNYCNNPNCNVCMNVTQPVVEEQYIAPPQPINLEPREEEENPPIYRTFQSVFNRSLASPCVICGLVHFSEKGMSTANFHQRDYIEMTNRLSLSSSNLNNDMYEMKYQPVDLLHTRVYFGI